MVEAVRQGQAVRGVARQFRVSPATVSRWVKRTSGRRLERCDFANRRRGPRRPWNRLGPQVEARVLGLRAQLRWESPLGEYGAQAIWRAWPVDTPRPAVRTMGRILARGGALDARGRVRRPPPPRGWYLPEVAAARAELDSFDLIEDLKLAAGPLVYVLTGISLHGGYTVAWPARRWVTAAIVAHLSAHWRAVGLPAYAQFDNDTRFQGAHQFPDTFGRVTRLCLALGVTPVFAPPREPGFQNAIESFNALWQAKVWQRFRYVDLAALQAQSARYVTAHRQRSAARRAHAPLRPPFPERWTLDLQAPPQGRIIYLRRTDDRGRVSVLGHRFAVCTHWVHRLVRCEVDLNERRLAFYAFADATRAINRFWPNSLIIRLIAGFWDNGCSTIADTSSR